MKYWVYSRISGAKSFANIISLILTTTLWGKFYCVHFTNQQWHLELLLRLLLNIQEFCEPQHVIAWNHRSGSPTIGVPPSPLTPTHAPKLVYQHTTAWANWGSEIEGICPDHRADQRKWWGQALSPGIWGSQHRLYTLFSTIMTSRQSSLLWLKSAQLIQNSTPSAFFNISSPTHYTLMILFLLITQEHPMWGSWQELAGLPGKPNPSARLGGIGAVGVNIFPALLPFSSKLCLPRKGKASALWVNGWWYKTPWLCIKEEWILKPFVSVYIMVFKVLHF